MASSSSSYKPVRKTVSFDSSERSQALLDAVETELASNHYRSFGDLCKAALHQFLLSREPTQSVILFMELERELAALQSRMAQLEETGGAAMQARIAALEAEVAQMKPEPEGVKEDAKPKARELDPVLARLTPLLEDF